MGTAIVTFLKNLGEIPKDKFPRGTETGLTMILGAASDGGVQ